MTDGTGFLARYQDGHYGQVWEQLRELGPLVREPEYLAQAVSVAHETMRRVRTNVETVYQRLLALGYEFEYPDEAFVPPSPHTQSVLTEIEQKLGHLPLSLTAFYLEVGSANFMQSKRQIIHYNEPNRLTASELSVLGEEDPLVVEPPSWSLKLLWTEEPPLKFEFAPDEFHKAYYSGGENYHLFLPTLSADFRIQGMYEVNEYFVDYLRLTLRFGGFRGRIETLDTITGKKHQPKLRIAKALGDNLLHF